MLAWICIALALVGEIAGVAQSYSRAPFERALLDEMTEFLFDHHPYLLGALGILGLGVWITLADSAVSVIRATVSTRSEVSGRLRSLEARFVWCSGLMVATFLVTAKLYAIPEVRVVASLGAFEFYDWIDYVKMSSSGLFFVTAGWSVAIRKGLLQFSDEERVVSNAGSSDPRVRLAALVQLRDQGLITPSDYERKKDQILADL